MNILTKADILQTIFDYSTKSYNDNTSSWMQNAHEFCYRV